MHPNKHKQRQRLKRHSKSSFVHRQGRSYQKSALVYTDDRGTIPIYIDWKAPRGKTMFYTMDWKPHIVRLKNAPK